MIRATRFLSELKRRSVFRVLIGYAVAAWLLIQIAETTFPYIGLPSWAVTLVIVLTLSGVPVALLLAWVFDITPEGIEVARPAAPTPTEAPARSAVTTAPLPAPATRIVGREAELEEAERLLQGPTRLLTVTGPGGTGKTRLALELAHRLAPAFRDRAAWVPLGAVRDPRLVVSAIGAAFDIGESGGEELLGGVAAALREAELLVVLDNFEQVVGAAPAVAELLAACPHLRILVTSRGPLHVRAERELSLAPLRVPDAARPASELFASPAVRLFRDRAQDVNPTFEVTDANVGDVAAICRRLDGLPLALELAAARSKVLSPTAMLARLDQRLSLLGQGSRDLAEHQRTLRDTIDWSHELLGAPERALFRRFAVFAGGCEVDAVEAVAGEGSEADVLDLLQALVDQSLVQPVVQDGADPRFTMLEVIREYASERLATSGEAERVRARHAAYFKELAESAEPQLVGPRQAEWLDRLEREHENLRGALSWLAEHDPAGGLRLATSLRRFWEVRGHLSEGRRRLERLLGAASVEESVALRLRALYALGVLADAQGDYAAARDHFAESLALNRAAGDAWGVANALNNMGVVALRHHDYEAAHRLYTESVGLWREIGNDAAVALALDNLGNVALLRGDHAAARASLEESLRMHRDSQDTNGCALTLRLLGDVARDEGALEEGERLYDESLALFRSVRNAPEVARSLLELGKIREVRGSGGEAVACYADALRTYAEIGSPRGLAETLDHFARCAAREGDASSSERFAAAARNLRERGIASDADGALALALGWTPRARPA